MQILSTLWKDLVNHWFEILLALAVVFSMVRIVVSMWRTPQETARSIKAMFSGAWADIRVTVFIVLIAISVGLGFIYKRLEEPFTALLWAMGCLVVGWLVGFLFGIPKVLQSDTALAQAQSNAAASGQQGGAAASDSPGASAATSQARGNQYQVNTNLEQISDWLTKIIVGLGLINLKQIPEHIQRLSNYMSPAMGSDSHVFAAALFLFFSVTGFLGGYITTRLWLAGAFSRADQTVGLPINSEQRSAVMSEDINFEKQNVSPAADQAAKQVVSQPLDQLTNKEDIAIWAKAQFSQGYYDRSVNGYAKAVELSPNDIELRLDYATALHYAKRPATQVADQLMAAYDLMKSTPKVSQDIKRKVYKQITHHLVYLPPREGFDKAIHYGEEYVNDPDNQPVQSAAIWTNLASAYGQKAKWVIENKESVDDFANEFKQARDSALNAVRKALEIDPNTREKLIELLVKNSPGKDPKENDLEVFEDDNDFRAALGLPPAVITLPNRFELSRSGPLPQPPPDANNASSTEPSPHPPEEGGAQPPKKEPT